MRVGTICYATEQGLGYLAHSFYKAGVITDALLFKHGSYQNHLEWYPPWTIMLERRPFAGRVLDHFLTGIDVMLFFETPFDWEVLKICKERGIKTAIMPMYEWWPENPPYVPDLFLCPSRLDQDYFPGHPFIPVPVRNDLWERRTTALKFLHNAGHIGFRGHKGTLELLHAVKHVKSPFSLTVRAQDTAGLGKLLDQVPGIVDDERVTIEFGALDYEKLWADHDVLIAPEKFNGLSLPLAEARAAGMFVMTTDRYPMNTWLPKEGLIPVTAVHKTRVAGPYREIDECEVDPVDIARVIDGWFNWDIGAYSLSGKEWANQNSWDVLKPQYIDALEALLP